MRCTDAHDRLQEHLDGLLLPLDRAAMDEHLSECASCQRDRSRLLALAEALELLPDADAPAGFTASVMSSLPEMLPAREGTGHLVRWGLAVAGLAAAFIVAIGLLPVAGPGVAQDSLVSLVASLQLGGRMLVAFGMVSAGVLDAVAGGLVATGPGAKVLFTLLLAGSSALLARLVRNHPGTWVAVSGGQRR